MITWHLGELLPTGQEAGQIQVTVIIRGKTKNAIRRLPYTHTHAAQSVVRVSLRHKQGVVDPRHKGLFALRAHAQTSRAVRLSRSLIYRFLNVSLKGSR
jgi:hypothetical protein